MLHSLALVRKYVLLVTLCRGRTQNVRLTKLLPHVSELKKSPYQFKIDFGLKELPTEPGVLLIRGARQYGKSTWLEQQIQNTIKQFGHGSAFYLNGDYIADVESLAEEIERLLPLYHKDRKIRRLFIDEITAVDQWEKALKRIADKGLLKNVLVVTTGSKATDLKRGTEKLPGRKGKLARSSYFFTPISYKEFKRVCGKALGKKTLPAYLLSGGSPIACSEIAQHGFIPEYVITLVRDWIEGEVAASNRSRSSLLNIMSVLFRLGGAAVGQSKLARESGLANNTVASGYIDLLNDLGCVTSAYPWDKDRKILVLRKPCKYHFTNLLTAVAYHPARLRHVDDFLKLGAKEQGAWYEWLVAQEIFRRLAIEGETHLDPFAFWQNKEHEIDFVVNQKHYYEVKHGNTNPLEFAWFSRVFTKDVLTVINAKAYQTDVVEGLTFEDFLLAD